MLRQRTAQSPADQTLLHSRPDAMQALTYRSVRLPALQLHQRRGSRPTCQALHQQRSPQQTAQQRLMPGRPPLPRGATTKTASLRHENVFWPASAKLAMHEQQFSYALAPDCSAFCMRAVSHLINFVRGDLECQAVHVI